MTIRLVNLRQVGSAFGMTDVQRAQLEHAGGHFDGQARTAEQRFVDMPIPPEDEAIGIDWDDGNLGIHLLYSAEVHRDGVYEWDLWCHHSDAGCLFLKGTATCVAGRVQFSWMNPELNAPHEHATELNAAMDEAKI
ncbi:hypothetical protein BH09MYX1_BH09MYX1_64480 [soil metagenome]